MKVKSKVLNITPDIVKELDEVVCGLADMAFCKDLNLAGVKNYAKRMRTKLKKNLKLIDKDYI